MTKIKPIPKKTLKTKRIKQLSFTRINNSEVAAVFRSYPKPIRDKLRYIRNLIIEAASTSNLIGILEETLKWGEPSYLTAYSKSGSTIRINWKPSNPEHISIFFKCTTNLIPTFKRKYPTLFNYDGIRSMYFPIRSNIPEKELKQCIILALTYHMNKQLPDHKRWIFENPHLV